MNDTALSLGDVLLRITAATATGVLIGLERESHGRPAGLRTTILACVAAAIAMILSESFYLGSVRASAYAGWHPDPARIGAGVLTGFGFLGAGTILRHENVILGVTTAASLWFATVLGLAFGSGQFVLGAVGVGIAAVALLLLPAFERRIPSEGYARLQVTMELDALSQQQLESRLKALGLRIIRMELRYDLAARQQTISCELKLARQKASDMSTKTVAELRQCPGILQVAWS